MSNLQSVDAAQQRKAEDEGADDNKEVIKDQEEVKDSYVDENMQHVDIMNNLNVDVRPSSVQEITFKENELPGKIVDHQDSPNL